MTTHDSGILVGCTLPKYAYNLLLQPPLPRPSVFLMAFQEAGVQAATHHWRLQ